MDSRAGWEEQVNNDRLGQKGLGVGGWRQEEGNDDRFGD